MKKKLISRYFVLALSITFIFLGVMREETKTVLRKAINICLECIGVG